MLTHLSIRNILLLKSCDIPFARGLNVLTGETGAGKSILLDALGLVLGERSDASLVRAGETTASVTAEFDISEHASAKSLLAELELEATEHLVIRRTLASDGKSRAFINDASVSAAALKRFGEILVARHGQHDQRGLLDSKTHRALLDDFANHPTLIASTENTFIACKEAVAAAEDLQKRAHDAAREEEWLRDTVAELGALDPQEGEEEQLSELRKRAQIAQASLGALREALALLAEEDGVALKLRRAAKLLAKTEALDEQVSATLERVETDVEEISVALERALAAAEIDPAEIERAEDRLHALRAASRKYKVAVELLSGLLADAKTKLTTLTNLEAEQKRTATALVEAEANYRAAAKKLHDAVSYTHLTLPTIYSV